MKLFALTFISLFIFASCKKDKDQEFDHKAMLENVADNIILPEYTNMEAELVELKASANSFVGSVSAENLSALKTSFRSAYKNVQRIKLFDFGPSSDYGLKPALNTYPTDADKIENNITTGSYTLAASGNIDAIGFPALDYLLFEGGETAVLNRFSTDPSSENAKAYLTELIEKMSTEVAAVHNLWTTSYRTTFVAAIGTDVGSSTSFIFNELLKDIELLKNAKTGIPAGQFSGGVILPEYVEAYYSEYSKELALESAHALKNMFTGKNGLGFDDFMDFKEKEATLPVSAATIIGQFDTSIAQLNALNNPFSSDVTTNAAGFTSTFQELKRLVAYIKVDVASSLGLLITYSDTDGD